MKTLLLSILLFSTSSFASNRGTFFDTLRDAYQSAPNPAVVEDFQTEKWENCIYVDAYDPNRSCETTTRVIDYEFDDRGPLFPKSGQRVDPFWDTMLDRNLEYFFASSNIEETPEYLKQTLRGQGWRSMNIYGKTDEGMLFFFVEIAPDTNPYARMEARVYGYCWNEESQQPPLPVPD